MQSRTALEGMTAKNAFMAGLCCLIPSGMYSPCPFDLKYGCLQRPWSHVFSSFRHSVHSVSIPSSWFRTPSLFLSSQPLLKVSLHSRSSISPLHTHTPDHLRPSSGEEMLAPPLLRSSSQCFLHPQNKDPVASKPASGILAGASSVCLVFASHPDVGVMEPMLGSPAVPARSCVFHYCLE